MFLLTDSALPDEHKVLEDELALKNSEILEKSRVISSLENGEKHIVY